jgi:hypothetical protein
MAVLHGCSTRRTATLTAGEYLRTTNFGEPEWGGDPGQLSLRAVGCRQVGSDLYIDLALLADSEDQLFRHAPSLFLLIQESPEDWLTISPRIISYPSSLPRRRPGIISIDPSMPDFSGKITALGSRHAALLAICVSRSVDTITRAQPNTVNCRLFARTKNALFATLQIDETMRKFEVQPIAIIPGD